jgi:hypothetical protein
LHCYCFQNSLRTVWLWIENKIDACGKIQFFIKLQKAANIFDSP